MVRSVRLKSLHGNFRSSYDTTDETQCRTRPQMCTHWKKNRKVSEHKEKKQRPRVEDSENADDKTTQRQNTECTALRASELDMSNSGVPATNQLPPWNFARSVSLSIPLPHLRASSRRSLLFY